MITYDTSVVQNGNGVNSFIFPALTTVLQNEIAICGFHFSNAGPTGVTFSSLNWTLLKPGITIPTTGGQIYIYAAPIVQPLAAVAITATFTSGGFPQASGVLGAFQNVNIANPTGSIASASSGASTDITTSITTTRQNSLVIAFIGQTANLALTHGANQTEANQTTSAGGFSRSQMTFQNSVTPAIGTSVSMDSSNTSAGEGIFVIELLDGLKGFPVISIRPRPFAPGFAR